MTDQPKIQHLQGRPLIGYAAILDHQQRRDAALPWRRRAISRKPKP